MGVFCNVPAVDRFSFAADARAGYLGLVSKGSSVGSATVKLYLLDNIETSGNHMRFQKWQGASCASEPGS